MQQNIFSVYSLNTVFDFTPKREEIKRVHEYLKNVMSTYQEDNVSFSYFLFLYTVSRATNGVSRLNDTVQLHEYIKGAYPLLTRVRADTLKKFEEIGGKDHRFPLEHPTDYYKFFESNPLELIKFNNHLGNLQLIPLSSNGINAAFGFSMPNKRVLSLVYGTPSLYTTIQEAYNSVGELLGIEGIDLARMVSYNWGVNHLKKIKKSVRIPNDVLLEKFSTPADTPRNRDDSVDSLAYCLDTVWAKTVQSDTED